MERLQKVIAASGICSRRKAEQYILDGRVKVDGIIVRELGTQVKKSALIEVDGESLLREDKVYYMMNKPRKVLSSVSDDRGRTSVVDLMNVKQRVFPIGRLDFDSSGLLLMTNDGEFANLIMHPRYQIEKQYHVVIKGILAGDDKAKLEKGILLDKKMTQKTKIKIHSRDSKKNITTLTMRISEGRNRQIRRMMEFCGYEVVGLHRKQVGTVTLGSLQEGEYRLLKPQEVKELRNLASKEGFK
jgi:pseudouridine synthase